MSNVKVSNLILDTGPEYTLSKRNEPIMLHWLGCVLRMSSKFTLPCLIFRSYEGVGESMWRLAGDVEAWNERNVDLLQAFMLGVHMTSQPFDWRH